MLFVGNGEELTQEIQHRKVIRNTMKVKLKEGVLVKDIPKRSSTHKRVVWAFNNGEKELELDVLPKGLDKYVEEVKLEKKKLKGAK